MDTVKVKVAELHKVIKANRENHRAEFELAQQGYREQVIEILDERLKAARAGKKMILSIVLPFPEDHTKEYDRVIRMLEMSVEEVIEIAQHEFAMYVMDDWSWKAGWAASNTGYMEKAKRL